MQKNSEEIVIVVSKKNDSLDIKTTFTSDISMKIYNGKDTTSLLFSNKENKAKQNKRNKTDNNDESKPCLTCVLI